MKQVDKTIYFKISSFSISENIEIQEGSDCILEAKKACKNSLKNLSDKGKAKKHDIYIKKTLNKNNRIYKNQPLSFVPLQTSFTSAEWLILKLV